MGGTWTSVRSRWGRMLLLAPIAVLLPCSPCSAKAPNILVVISDDQATFTMGHEGHPWSRTPALDALAYGGARFVNAFVTTSLCSPARASLLTGRYVRGHGVHNNRQPFPDVPTFASLLTAEGYDSAYVGKWHMGDERGARPGFGYTASYAGQGRYGDNVFLVGTPQAFAEVGVHGWVDDVATDYAVEFLRRRRDRPFLLVLGLKSPHRPHEPPPRYRSLYADVTVQPPDNADAAPPFPSWHDVLRLARSLGATQDDYRPPEDWRDLLGAGAMEDWDHQRTAPARRVKDYFRTIRGIDDNVARLVQALRETGSIDDTLFVYTSDNGMCLGNHGIGGKRIAYEESMRVPMLVSFPGHVRPGLVAEELVLNVDLAPTLLDYAGVDPSALGADGVSLRPILEERCDPGSWRSSFAYEFYFDGIEYMNGYVPTVFALRTVQWKLIEYLGYPSWTELYDLRHDPYECTNLAGEEAGRLKTLFSELHELERRLGPRLDL
jgi:arylsulfatase A-like enzyme